MPHSGTRFTRQILWDAGVEHRQYHFRGTWRPDFIYKETGPVIIPMRSYDAVRESWEKRGKGEPKEGEWASQRQDLDKAWAQMREYVETHEVYPFRLDDTEHRDADLLAISRLVGKPLWADYSKKVGAFTEAAKVEPFNERTGQGNYVVRVLSVPHSGTRFIKRTLERYEIPARQVHFDGLGNNPLIHDDETPAIVALRDKELVRDSWKRRGKYRRGKEFEAAWSEMESYVASHNVTLFRVADEVNREADLAAVSRLVGVELTADFGVKVGASH